ncbi:MAG: hypothetical protein ABW252_00375 [Polyangiales bacterium]
MTVIPSQLGRASRMGLLTGLLGLFGTASIAHASGPTERIQQVFTHPTDPSRITVRFGMATSGYLYSTDGGKTFRAMCSTAVAPEAEGTSRVRKISLRSIGSTAANAMDTEGGMLFSQYPGPEQPGLYAGDASGCSWSSVPFFAERWAFGLQADPAVEGVVWAAVSDTSSTEQMKLEIARRDAEGNWTTVGPIVPPAAGAGLLDGNLLVASHEGKTHLYVTANVGTLSGQYAQHVYASADDGKTWEDHVLPATLDSLALLAVDPQDPARLVGVIWRDGQPDPLFLSEDHGKTFVPYPGNPEVRAASGATFDARGRFIIADQGDGVSEDVSGGLLVADRLGARLTRAEGTSYADCVHYRALTDTLYVCSYDKLTTVDPNTFEARELVRLESVSGVLECPGRNLTQECEEQFNEGSAWCCTGHFPFTPFCGAYDVTVLPNGRRVFCGLAGREYERPGSTQGNQGDAGSPLASVDGAPEAPPAVRPKASSGGGCALGEASGAGLASGLLSALTVALAAMSGRRPRRRRGD